MRLQLKLRSFFFVVITVALVALTIFLGRVVYSDLYRKILLTFDQKLLAASTVVASFVSGEDHDKIVQVTQLRGLAYNQGRMYGRYAAAPDLINLNPPAPFTRHLVLDPEPYYTTDITFAEGMIYAASPEDENGDASIISIDPATGKTETLVGIDDYCVAVGYVNGALYCAGEKLIRVTLENGKAGEPEEVTVLESPITGLTESPDGKQLIGTETNTRKIVFLNPEDGSITRSVELKRRGEAYPFGVFSIVYDSLRKTYYGVSSTALITINMESGEVQELPGVAFGPAGAQKTYVDLVRPMIRVREGTKIRFLYSAVLVDRETRINYALDSTQSDIHSHVGIEDSNEAEDDIRDVILKREIYLSDIKDWDDWGLLKSSYVPILNREGDAVAYAGADVNIDIIESATRTALLQVVIIGVVALVAGLIIAYFSTERLTRPIYELKQSALQVAAGGFGNEIHVENPAELTHLSGSLTRLSRSLQETVTSLTGENFRLEEKRRRNELSNLVRSFMKHKSAVDFFDATRKLSMGLFEDSQYLAIWAGHETEDKLEATRLHSDIFRISRRLLQQSPDDYMESMAPFVGKELELLVLIHRTTGQIKLHSTSDMELYPVKKGGNAKKNSLEAGQHELEVRELRALYLVQGSEKSDRSSSLQGDPVPRVSAWKQDAGSDSLYLEVIL
ncbi:MAG TPA: hypothetical protein DEA96_02075 [Leptospiraceae bacterium]|nr:hypothetical protein [Spirochaetaceae bacterium]HBS03722.1 hypothetical protein [Leptospiraceae bacterium]|tara:strand:+ start:6131 stop:8164 length:2034 start_codon:yes stop_codon:yes gene_type:complete